jgi:hypothetical protein
MSDCLLQVSNTQSNEQQESNMNYSEDVHSDVGTPDRNGLYIQETTNNNMHPSQQQGTDKDRPDKTELVRVSLDAVGGISILFTSLLVFAVADCLSD